MKLNVKIVYKVVISKRRSVPLSHCLFYNSAKERSWEHAHQTSICRLQPPQPQDHEVNHYGGFKILRLYFC